MLVSNPSLTEATAYLAYLGGIGAYVFSRKQSVPSVVSGVVRKDHPGRRVQR